MEKNITATFGDLDYRDNGEIVLPITFSEDVLDFHKSSLTITKVAGSEPYEMEYYLSQNKDARDNTYNLNIFPAHGTAGIICVGF